MSEEQRNPTPTNVRFPAVNLTLMRVQVGKHMVHQVRRCLRHSLRAAQGAKPAAQAHEAVGQDAALQEGVELVFDELRQPGTGGLFGLGEESRCLLLHQAVQRGLLGAVAVAVDRGTIAMCSPGLVSGVGLHALGIGNLRWCSFSGRAGQRIRLCEDHRLPSPRPRPCSDAVPCPAAPAVSHAVAALARCRPWHDISIDPGRRFPRPSKAGDRPRRPKELVHGRVIGASHARLAQRRVCHSSGAPAVEPGGGVVVVAAAGLQRRPQLHYLGSRCQRRTACHQAAGAGAGAGGEASIEFLCRC